jgi:hypothetical protein
LPVSKFCQNEASILLDVLRPLFEDLFSRCSKSDADFSTVESEVTSVLKVVRSELVSRGLDVSIRCCSRDYGCPECDQSLTAWGDVPRQVVTSAGSGTFSVGRYRCTRCEIDYYPVLEGNALVGGQYTLGAKERIVTEASESCYAKVSRDLPEVGIEVSPNPA